MLHGTHSFLLFFALRAILAYDQFYFATNATDWLCDGLSFTCIAPQVCVHDGLLNKAYCCDPGSPDEVCWTGSTDCGSGQGQPASGQTGCSSGDSAFCCLEDREECTQRTGQVNICWSTAANPVAKISNKRMNATFSSLSSASADATTLSVATASLFATSKPTTSPKAARSSSSSAATSPTSSAEPAKSTSSPVSSSKSSSASGGAIAGIVIGVLAGLGLLAAAAFFFWRRSKRRRQNNRAEIGGNPSMQGGYGALVAEAPGETREQHGDPHKQYYDPPAEMAAESVPIEVPGSQPREKR